MRTMTHTLAVAIMTTAFLLQSVLVQGAAPPRLHVESVDPLQNVFRDSAITSGTPAHADVARGEHATFQLVVTSSPLDIRALRCDVTTFTAEAPNTCLLYTSPSPRD